MIKVLKIIVVFILVAFILLGLNYYLYSKYRVIDYNFILNGEKELTLFENEDYEEEGFEIISEEGKNLKEYVTIENNLNIKNAGIYEIKYKASYRGLEKELSRKVNVIVKDNIDKWVEIPTYDGSKQTTHPKVIYFENGYNGYKYWMVHTPYPYNDAYLENPSIAVSNDGINWTTPEGIKNPVSGYASIYSNDSYYSDPFMLYDGNKFEIFFRRTQSYLNGVHKRNGYNYMYHIESEDGINWTKPKLILGNNPKEQYMSVSVYKTNDLYKMWYVNYDGKIRYIESNDLETFTEPIDVKIENFNKNVWHKEIQYIDGKYICVFMIKYKLFYTESKDGINFSEPREINTKLENINTNVYNVYKTSFIVTDKYIELFMPYGVNHIWKMKYIKISKDDFYNTIYKNSE